MKTPVTRMLGIEHPVFAFSHCREVVAAVSRAGGMGVYGAATFSPERVDVDLEWISRNCAGMPFGIDLMMPVKSDGKGSTDVRQLEARLTAELPNAHRKFVQGLLHTLDVPPLETAPPPPPDDRPGGAGWRTSWHDFRLGAVESGALLHLEVALRHPIALLVTALGPPTPDVVTRARAQGIRLGALVGNPEQARSQVAAGVDLVVAQGTEAAAHTGEISTMVLVPEVVGAVSPVPVLAAGGIACGAQAAAALALGAQGVWTGSMWLTTTESDEPKEVVTRLLAAGSRDTVRSRCRTGKPLRQLKSPWSKAWAEPDSPGTLPMPTQHLLTADAEERFNRHHRDDLMTIPVGQAVGALTEVRPAAEVLAELVADCDDVLLRLPALAGHEDGSDAGSGSACGADR